MHLSSMLSMRTSFVVILLWQSCAMSNAYLRKPARLRHPARDEIPVPSFEGPPSVLPACSGTKYRIGGGTVIQVCPQTTHPPESQTASLLMLTTVSSTVTASPSTTGPSSSDQKNEIDGDTGAIGVIGGPGGSGAGGGGGDGSEGSNEGPDEDSETDNPNYTTHHVSKDSKTTAQPTNSGSRYSADSESTAAPTSRNTPSSTWTSVIKSATCTPFTYPSERTADEEDDNTGSGNGPKLLKRVADQYQRSIYSRVNDCPFPNGQLAATPQYYGINQFLTFRNVAANQEQLEYDVYSTCLKFYTITRSCNKFLLGRIDNPANANNVNIDHVYEKQLIILFMQSQIGQNNKFSCQDMNAIFFNCGGVNRMQMVMEQLPAMALAAVPSARPPITVNTNPGFAAIDIGLNQAKGYMFANGVIPASQYFTADRLNSVDHILATLQDFILLFSRSTRLKGLGLLRYPEIQTSFDVTNDRVYAALQMIDHTITVNGLTRGNAGGPIPATWAQDYKNWMTKYLQDIVTPVWQWCDRTAMSIKPRLNNQQQKDTLETLKRYLVQADFSIDFALSWTTIVLPREDIQGGDLCIPSASSTKAMVSQSSTSGYSLSSQMATTNSPTTTSHTNPTPKPDCSPMPFNPNGPCPYAYSGYCNCNGIFVPSLQDVQPLDCSYVVAPTSNNCPNEPHDESDTIPSLIAQESAFQAALLARISSSQVALPPPSSTTASASEPPLFPTSPPLEVAIFAESSNDFCPLLTRDPCQAAYHQFSPATIYSGLTSFSSPASASTCPGFQCKATYACATAFLYGRGLYGSQIIAAFDKLYTDEYIDILGTSQLLGGCIVSLGGNF